MIRALGSRVLRFFGLQRRKWVDAEVRKRVRAANASAKSGQSAARANIRRNEVRGVFEIDVTTRLMMEMGEIETVLRVTRARLEHDPANPSPLALFARCQLLLNNPALAVEYYAEAEACGGFSVELRREHAEALDLSGQTDAARRLLLAAMRTYPSVWQFFWDYAALIESRPDYDAMLEVITDLRAAGKSGQALERALAKGAMLIGETATAERIYRRLIAQQLAALQKELNKAPSDGAALGLIVRQKRNELDDGKGERCLLDAKAALDKGGIPFFLMAGTVLGLVRDGRLLKGDKDVDIGVFAQDYDKPRIIAALKDDGRFRIARVDHHADRLRVIHRNGVWVDIFPYFPEDGRSWHAGSVVRWWHEPFTLTPFTLQGQDFMIPAPTEAYLEWNYGPGWREPDPLFDVYKDAPNAEVISPEHLRYFAWRKLFEACRTRDWVRLDKVLSDYPELQDDTRVLPALKAMAGDQIARMR